MIDKVQLSLSYCDFTYEGIPALTYSLLGI